MRMLLAYSSQTGNTQKIAEKLNEQLHPDCVCRANEVDDAMWQSHDVIILGGWIDKGHFNEQAKQLMHRIQHKRIAFFFTLGAYPTGMHAYECLERIKNDCMRNGNEVLGHFHCQGAVSPKLIEQMRKLPAGHSHAPDAERLQRWQDAAAHPNEEDFHAAESFAAALQKKLASVEKHRQLRNSNG